MNIGIVGSEAAKFTARTEAAARDVIRRLVQSADAVVSGACHLGGIDVWAAEEARRQGVPLVEHRPRILKWDGGYKDRNLLIVRDSDRVVCVTVQSLPPGYTGMWFRRCYHCGTDKHVKSGGCWTVKQARNAGKIGDVIVIDPEGQCTS